MWTANDDEAVACTPGNKHSCYVHSAPIMFLSQYANLLAGSGELFIKHSASQVKQMIENTLEGPLRRAVQGSGDSCRYS